MKFLFILAIKMHSIFQYKSVQFLSSISFIPYTKNFPLTDLIKGVPPTLLEKNLSCAYNQSFILKSELWQVVRSENDPDQVNRSLSPSLTLILTLNIF